MKKRLSKNKNSTVREISDFSKPKRSFTIWATQNTKKDKLHNVLEGIISYT